MAPCCTLHEVALQQFQVSSGGTVHGNDLSCSMLSLSGLALPNVPAGVACHQLTRWAAHNQQCGLEQRSILVAWPLDS